MLEKLFYPKSIAVIGASRQEGKVGHSILKNLLQHGYRGKIYPINPKAEEIFRIRAYPTILGVQGEIDLAVIAIPSQFVPSVLKDCVNRKVGVVVIISAGFKESGKQGSQLERELVEIIRNSGVRVLGPNCLGVIDTGSSLNASFAAGMPCRGNIAFFSQSGALCTAVLDWALEEGVGFSKFISLGNKADIDEVDLLLTLAEDGETKVILGYLEGISNGSRFMEVAREVSRKKPVIITKSGRTQAGARAASSHTGTLTGLDTAYEAAFRQCGIIRAETVQTLFDYAIAFAQQPVPRGPNVAILTNAGGPAIIATDAVENSTLRMASFKEDTISRLREELPPNASIYNPVDVIGDAGAERYEKAMKTIVNDPGVDSLTVILAPQAMTKVKETAEVISKVSSAVSEKTVVASFMGQLEVKEGRKILSSGKIPNYSYPERTISALEAMVKYKRWKETPLGKTLYFEVNKKKAEEIFTKAKEKGKANLTTEETREVLSAYGFFLPRRIVTETSREAISAANSLGYPVVMKVVSPDILHKSDVGGVKVGITGKSQVVSSFEDIIANAKRFMPEALILGVTVEEMIEPGKEVILGSSRDPSFGPLLMFGLGGIYIEVLKDVTFRIAPLTSDEAESMIREIRSYPILKGMRGEKSSDLAAVREALLRLSQLVSDFPEILEIDINPLMVLSLGKGAVVIDSRLTIKI
ncbi:CoA-binding protein [bacterium]|nr:CoA-binding protein [bacterium]NIN91469.1 CoA-binding protein [bacterium]NIO17879.1 CoA-binding protein [bacterium]NIO72860.1 CoA-binding protein [bacterium]